MGENEEKGGEQLFLPESKRNLKKNAHWTRFGLFTTTTMDTQF